MIIVNYVLCSAWDCIILYVLLYFGYKLSLLRACFYNKLNFIYLFKSNRKMWISQFQRNVEFAKK